MDKLDFLQKLFAVFPPEKNLDEVMAFYSSTLDTNKKYDYEKLLKLVGKEYTFKTLPPTSWLIKKREECVFHNVPKYSGREGEIVKRKFRGQEYEFVIVPNNWTNVKTISQVDEMIKNWNNRQDDFEQKSLYED